LIGWWKFDEGANQTTVDSSPNAVSCTLGDGVCLAGAGVCPAWTSTSRHGKALTFDGTNDYVDVPYANYNFNYTDPFTIAAWIKPTTIGVANTIFGRSEASTDYKGYSFMIIAAGTTWPANSLVFYIISSNAGVNGLWMSTGVNTITAAVWQHVAVTYDGTGAPPNFYINGINSPLATSTGTLNASTTRNVNIHVGDDYDGDYFNGQIDDLRVYNRVLAPGEIRQLFDLGQSHMGD
jgi:hypothetical protein